VSFDGVSAVARNEIAEDPLSRIQARGHEIPKVQMQEWFNWIDQLLDVHRSQFVLREATPAQLEEHKIVFKEAIRYCLAIHTLVADPDFNEPELVARLHVRIRQLQDAYDTFHDATLSTQEADEVLKRVFPE
jgi:hypothetical protein